jgi:prevent-host-death family protein
MRPQSLAQYNITDAKAFFSQLLQRVVDGEEIVIARAGRPIARLVPYDGPQPRHLGLLRAHIVRHGVARGR